MGGIFINYRRADAPGEALHLFSDLAEHFGADRVFMDVATIAPGRDFRTAIEQGVGSCDVLVAVMGTKWTEVAKPAGETDYVHLELATALRRDIPVIPVLVQDAAPPHPRTLPPELEALAFRNGFEVRHTRWDVDVNELKRAIEKIVPAAAVPATDGTAHGGTRPPGGDPVHPRRVLGPPARTAAIVAAVVVAVGAIVVSTMPDPRRSAEFTTPSMVAPADTQAVRADSPAAENDLPAAVPADAPVADERSGGTPERPEGAGPGFTGQPPVHLGWDSRRMSPAQAALKAVESMRDRENFIRAEARGNDAWGYDERSFVLVHAAPVDDGSFIFVVAFGTDSDEAGRLRNAIREDVFDDRRLSLQAPRVFQSPRARAQGPLAARWTVFDKGGLSDFAACAQEAMAANGLQVIPNDNHTAFGASATASMVALAVSHAGNTEVLVVAASGDAAEAERLRDGVRASIGACTS